MQKHIVEENGIGYILGEDGPYYLDLRLPEETQYPIGKYGRMRKIYLQEYRKGMYMELVLYGKVNEHLHQIDEECYQMMERLIDQMKEKQGVTEKLKAENRMLWDGMMNNIKSGAEEVLIKQIVMV